MKEEEIVRPPLFNLHIDYFNGSIWDIPVSGPSEAEEIGKMYAKFEDVMNVYFYPIGYKDDIWSHYYIKKFERKEK